MTGSWYTEEGSVSSTVELEPAYGRMEETPLLEELCENTWLWLLPPSRMKMTDGLAVELDPVESESDGVFLGRAGYEEVLSPRLLHSDSPARFLTYPGDASPAEVESGTHSLLIPPPDEGVWSGSWKRPPTSAPDDTSEDDPLIEGGGPVVEEGSSVLGRGGRSGGLSASIFTAPFPGFLTLTEEEEKEIESTETLSLGSTESGLTSFPSSRGIGNGSCALLFSSEMKLSVLESRGGAGRAF
jgi:hypothetical protein